MWLRRGCSGRVAALQVGVTERRVRVGSSSVEGSVTNVLPQLTKCLIAPYVLRDMTTTTPCVKFRVIAFRAVSVRFAGGRPSYRNSSHHPRSFCPHLPGKGGLTLKRQHSFATRKFHSPVGCIGRAFCFGRLRPSVSDVDTPVVADTTPTRLLSFSCSAVLI